MRFAARYSRADRSEGGRSLLHRDPARRLRGGEFARFRELCVGPVRRSRTSRSSGAKRIASPSNSLLSVRRDRSRAGENPTLVLNAGWQRHRRSPRLHLAPGSLDTRMNSRLGRAVGGRPAVVRVSLVVPRSRGGASRALNAIVMERAFSDALPSRSRRQLAGSQACGGAGAVAGERPEEPCRTRIAP